MAPPLQYSCLENPMEENPPEEPGRLQSMGSLRVGHDWTTSLSLFTFMHWRRKWQPTPVFLPGNPRDGGAWWAAIYGVAQSQPRLKWLSKCLIEFSCEAIWSCAFVFWEILVMASISVLVIGFFIIFISSWFSLRRLNFSKNLSISSRLSTLLPYSCS